jgi:hemerythrin
MRGGDLKMSGEATDVMFRWTTDYAVGIRQIDEEHQRLFGFAESLHRAMLDGKGTAALAKLHGDLVNYTVYHFAHEEHLMERIGYPDYRQHLQEHENLRSRVRAIQDRLVSGEITMTIEVMQFLMAWLNRHITTSDYRIGSYIKTSGLPLLGKVRGA